MNAIEGRLSHTQDQRAALLERHVGGAGNQRVGQSMCDCRKSAHRTGQNNHSVGWIAAAGDGRANVGVGVLDCFCGFCCEEFFEEIVAARNAQFLSHHAQRVL
jgi:hypothetical protein